MPTSCQPWKPPQKSSPFNPFKASVAVLRMFSADSKFEAPGCIFQLKIPDRMEHSEDRDGGFKHIERMIFFAVVFMHTWNCAISMSYFRSLFYAGARIQFRTYFSNRVSLPLLNWHARNGEFSDVTFALNFQKFSPAKGRIFETNSITSDMFMEKFH